MSLYSDAMDEFVRNDLPLIPEQWVIYNPHMSIGPFLTKEEAVWAVEVSLGYAPESVEYITVGEFLLRYAADPELEIEPFG